MSNKNVQRIANSINLLTRLPDDDSMVFVLGTGSESSNVEALAIWVERQSDLLSIDQPDFMIEQLIHRLHCKLDDFNSLVHQ